MLIRDGYYYHIKDDFFRLVNDPTLMSNKENGGYRPHFLAIKDAGNPSIFWMVPVSSKHDKYKRIVEQQTARYGRCTKIVLGKCDGKDAAYLIQNSFPVIAEYFDHIHTSNGRPLTLHASTGKAITEYLLHNLKLHKKGVRLFFSDIDNIYNLMLEKLSLKND